jgi:hypothetical protein
MEETERERPRERRATKGRRVSGRTLVAVLAFVLGLGTIPHRVCEREAGAVFDGRSPETGALAASVAAWTRSDLAPSSFATGSRRFDGEWTFGTYVMGALGFGQLALALEHARAGAAETADATKTAEATSGVEATSAAEAASTADAAPIAQDLARMEASLDGMLSARAQAFDREAWGGEDADVALDGAPRGHVAWLGYAGLALALHREVVAANANAGDARAREAPEARPPGDARDARADRFEAIEQRFVRAIARRFDASPSGFVETYPGETYPVDNASALAALAVHARATGEAPPPTLAKGLQALRERAVDPATGLLAQSVTVESRAVAPGEARGSGTALACYFLSFADPALSASLYRALRVELFRTVLGFGAVLEHAGGAGAGSGQDIDSGPVVFGFGVSATGFALGASRAHGDRDAFRALYATAHLFGAPYDAAGARTYATGGPLGDAILFAMTTAPLPAGAGGSS